MALLMEKTLLEVTEEFELRIPMTYEQFLTKLGEDVHAEWVNGETILFIPPKPTHQRVIRFLLALIQLYVEHFDLGEVLTAPVEMKARSDGNSREPDLLFVAKENLHRFSETKLAGPADLIIEIVSPESIRRDTVDKRLEYEAEGVREYWIVDNRAGSEQATFYVMDQFGHYQLVEPSQDGLYTSTILPNFWINVNWLWAKPQPNTLEAFALVVGAEALVKAINQSQLKH